MSATVAVVAILLICFFIFSNGLPFMANYGFARFIRQWLVANEHSGKLWYFTNDRWFLINYLRSDCDWGANRHLDIGVYGLLLSKARLWLLKISYQLDGGHSIYCLWFSAYNYWCLGLEAFLGNGMSVLTASLLLGIMILPTIISLSESAIRTVPKTYYSGSLALGASHERSILVSSCQLRDLVFYQQLF